MRFSRWLNAIDFLCKLPKTNFAKAKQMKLLRWLNAIDLQSKLPKASDQRVILSKGVSPRRTFAGWGLARTSKSARRQPQRDLRRITNSPCARSNILNNGSKVTPSRKAIVYLSWIPSSLSLLGFACSAYASTAKLRLRSGWHVAINIAQTSMLRQFTRLYKSWYRFVSVSLFGFLATIGVCVYL